MASCCGAWWWKRRRIRKTTLPAKAAAAAPPAPSGIALSEEILLLQYISALKEAIAEKLELLETVK